VTQYLICGALGGFLPDILRLVTKLREGTVPSYLKTKAFWFSLVLLAIIGAVAVWLTNPTSTREAVMIGFSAPEVISRLASQTKQVDRADGAQLSVLDWWKL